MEEPMLYTKLPIVSHERDGKNGRKEVFDFRQVEPLKLAEVCHISMKQGDVGWRAGHFHKDATEIVMCIEGKVKIRLSKSEDSEEFILEGQSGYAVMIPPGVQHNYWISGGSQVMLYSCTEHNFRMENDTFEIEQGELAI